MIPNRPLYLGPRIRRLRREMGLTQATMAEDLGVSASYVALLERNQRPLTADLLLRLARTYRLSVDDLAAEDASAYATRLGAVLRDPLFADIDVPALELADLATSFPGVSEAILRLHRAHAQESQALAARQLGAEAQGDDPVEEARRFLAAHRNHFPALDRAAEDLAGEIAQAGGEAEWLRAKGTRLRLVPPQVLVNAIRRHDRHNAQLLVADTLPAPTRAFQVASHIAWSALRREIGAVVEAERFASEAGQVLARRALAAYAAGALRMPYAAFHRAAEARRCDVEALMALFGASFEQVAHRLTTLQRAGAQGVPFFFLRVDEAGNASKRLDGAGFPFAAHGGACPLWSVHAAFRAPGRVLTQWLELPDGQRFFSIARTVTSGGGGTWDSPGVTRAVALACAAEHAPRLAYAEGIDPTKVVATPIGVTCRLCQRAQCPARAAPPIGRTILADDQRRGVEPYAFAED